MGRTGWGAAAFRVSPARACSAWWSMIPMTESCGTEGWICAPDWWSTCSATCRFSAPQARGRQSTRGSGLAPDRHAVFVQRQQPLREESRLAPARGPPSARAQMQSPSRSPKLRQQCPWANPEPVRGQGRQLEAAGSPKWASRSRIDPAARRRSAGRNLCRSAAAIAATIESRSVARCPMKIAPSNSSPP